MNNSQNFCIIYCTYPSLLAAEESAKILLEQKLIVCANILPAGKSLYFWEGKLEQTQEFTAIFKSLDSLYNEIEKEIKSHHSYQTPCILKIKIDTVEAEYLSWAVQNIKKP